MPRDLAHALYTADQVRRIDRCAIEQGGIAGFELMRRAAQAAFDGLRRHWPQVRRIGVLAGTGNNGGDALLLARLARAAGLDVIALGLPGTPHGDAARARDAFVADGGALDVLGDEGDWPDVDVWIDGLFGTGLNRAPDGLAARAIEWLNASGRPVLALDLPSGLDADRGVAFAPCVRAQRTISFVAWKRGLFTADAGDCCGALELATLDIPPALHATIEADAELLGAPTQARLAPRARNVNKGRYGHVLAIGGEHGMGGAIRLAGEAALRSGAGLVSIATRESHVVALNAARPELMAHGVDGRQSLEPLLDRADVLALGPGLGTAAWGHALWDAALAAGKPCVIDADALNLLARLPRELPPGCVLTPHPGEAARLLGTAVAAVQGDRFDAARTLARRHRAVVVLKGSGSLVAAPDGRLAVCPWGNPGMASAGMGDVLTGVVAALLAQGLAPWDAACFGAGAHARAGDRAAGAQPRGLIAGDLFAPLRAIVNEDAHG